MAGFSSSAFRTRSGVKGIRAGERRSHRRPRGDGCGNDHNRSLRGACSRQLRAVDEVDLYIRNILEAETG